MREELKATIATLARKVIALQRFYEAGDTHAAERIALDIQDEVARLRHRLLDELHEEYQRSRKG